MNWFIHYQGDPMTNGFPVYVMSFVLVHLKSTSKNLWTNLYQNRIEWSYKLISQGILL